MYIHNSPLFLASRLHQSAANYSHNINSGWTFSGQTICILFLGRLYISNDSGEPFPPDSMVAGEGSCTKCSRNQKDDCIGTEYAKIWKDKKKCIRGKDIIPALLVSDCAWDQRKAGIYAIEVTMAAGEVLGLRDLSFYHGEKRDGGEMDPPKTHESLGS